MKTEKFTVPEMQLVEKRLQELNALDNPELTGVTGYVLGQGGKRLRPLLVLLCSDIYGADLQARIDVAAAAELIHSASLLHDDVVDNSVLRRGLPSANERWGNSTAVLAGDFLFARAYSLLSSYPNVLTIMTQAISTMCLGELNQLYAHFNPDTSPEDYVETIMGKTASLLAASCQCGVAISPMPPEEIRQMHKFALHLGIAYQVLDDITDYVFPANLSGKPTGNDIRNGIVTLPLLYLLANPGTRGKVQFLLEQREPVEPKMLAADLAATGAIEKAVAIACHHLNRAQELLNGVPSCQALFRLESLVKQFLERSRTLSKRPHLAQESGQLGQYPRPPVGLV